MAAGLGQFGHDGQTLTLGLQTIAAGENEKEVRAAKLGDLGAEAVIVAEAEFLDGHGVVFVDHGNDAREGPQLSEGVFGIAAALQAVDVTVGEEELGGGESVAGECLLVGAHELCLAHGGAGLFGRQRFGPRG